MTVIAFFTGVRRGQDPPGLIFLAKGALPGVRLLSAANLVRGLARSLSARFALPRSLSMSLAGALSPGLAAGLPGVLTAGLVAAVLATDRALSLARSRGMTLVLALSAAAAVEADRVVTLGLPSVAFTGITPKFLSCKWKGHQITLLLLWLPGSM